MSSKNIILKVKNDLYSNADAIPALLTYINNATAVYTSGYGFYPTDSTMAIQRFQEVQDCRNFSCERQLWHLILCFSHHFSFQTIATIAYQVAEIFSSNGYLVFYGIHEKRDQNGKRYHIHFAIQASSYYTDYPDLTFEQMSQRISQIEYLIATHFNSEFPLYVDMEA